MKLGTAGRAAMRRYKWILFVFVVFAAILIVARYISWQIGINFRVTYLLVMLATWVAMSIIVAVQRSALPRGSNS